MVKISLRDALECQERHVQHYGDMYPGGVEALRTAVAVRTNVKGMDLDAQLDIVEINRRVPRGHDIEVMCGIARADD